jgi:hypothetical protein
MLSDDQPKINNKDLILIYLLQHVVGEIYELFAEIYKFQHII